MTRGSRQHWVSLANPSDKTDVPNLVPLSPAGVWAAIRPLSPSDNGRAIQTEVEMDYHPEVTVDTRILFGTQHLVVRGLQNLDYANITLRLVCEEAI